MRSGLYSMSVSGVALRLSFGLSRRRSEECQCTRTKLFSSPAREVRRGKLFQYSGFRIPWLLSFSDSSPQAFPDISLLHSILKGHINKHERNLLTDRVAKATNVLFIMMKSWVSHCTLSSFYFCHQGLLTWDFKVLQVGLGLFIIKVIFQEKANYRFTRGATLKTLFRTFELQYVCLP